ncbi:MAG: CapA family protein [Chloroflexota bacterium]
MLVACQGLPFDGAQQALPTLAAGISDPLTPPPTPPITPSAEGAVVDPTVEPPVTESANTATPTTAPAPTETAWTVAVDPAVPGDLQRAVEALIAAQSGRFRLAQEGERADVQLGPGEDHSLSTWVYAVAVPFATVDDTSTLADLQQNWQTGGAPQAVLGEQVQEWLAQAWGPGDAETVAVEEAAGALWQRRTAWSLVPFHRLTPDLKVLAVDGQSPLDAGFDPSSYPLVLEVGVSGQDPALDAFLAAWDGPQSNYRPQRITRVAMTGVTALVRATAYQMEIRGVLYPGEEVAPVLQAADVAHVINEVSFVPDCPTPHYIGDPVFCSDPGYMALLEELGVDVVELTGNHLNDWGAQYVPYTLDLYDEAGMRYFGGGRDLAQAQEPLLVEHNDNQIAFVGCNPVGPAGGWATEQRAGSAPCEWEAFQEQIGALDDAGHVVIATQQYQEIYEYAPTSQQRADFAALAEAGAAAVSGSQGHHAQGFDFHEGAFIHYGLGNLFFDQMDRMGTRQTFVDQYVIYENRLLSVALWTGLIENYARPRLMTAEERADLLQTVFEASGW